MISNEEFLLKTINEMLHLCEPIYIKDFNVKVRAINVQKLRDAENKNQKIGISNYNKEKEGISTLSLIATITDILCNKRLAFNIDENGIITKVTWFGK